MAKKVIRKSAESTDRIRTGAAYIRVSTDDQLEYSHRVRKYGYYFCI